VRPSEFAGRDEEIERFDVLRARAALRRPERSIIMHGLGGVGKTVLLNEFADAARRDGWITAKIEADLGSGRTPFASLVAQALNTSLRQIQRKSDKTGRLKTALRTFKSFSLGIAPDGSSSVGLDIDPDRGRGDTGSLQADLTDLAVDLGEAALELGIGVVLFIDEMQHLSKEELAAVCQACHEASQRNLPFFIVGAGLPNLPACSPTPDPAVRPGSMGRCRRFADQRVRRPRGCQNRPYPS
jgi:AAA ATPase domain